MSRDLRIALLVTLGIFLAMWLASALGYWITGVP